MTSRGSLLNTRMRSGTEADTRQPGHQRSAAQPKRSAAQPTSTNSDRTLVSGRRSFRRVVAETDVPLNPAPRVRARHKAPNRRTTLRT